MATLGENHRSQVSRFVSFFKGKRDRFSTLLHERRDDTKGDRLNDDIYPHVDVEQHMDVLAEALHELGKDELQKTAQISAAYVVELMAQAEQNGVELGVDISIVEDESKLQGVTDLSLATGAKAPVLKKQVLSAIGQETSDVNTLQQVGDLREENRILQERNVGMQKQLNQLFSERQQAWDELDTVKIDFLTYKRDIDERLQAANIGHAGYAGQLSSELNEAHSQLQVKKDEIQLLQSDMTRHINDTTQFKDLKNIVAKKNGIIKDLRGRLSKYEPDDIGIMYAED